MLLRKIEKAFYIALVLLGAILFLSAFLGSSLLNMVARIAIGGTVSIGAMLEIFPDIIGKICRKCVRVVKLTVLIVYVRVNTLTSRIINKIRTRKEVPS